jgi:hypothetical protein
MRGAEMVAQLRPKFFLFYFLRADFAQLQVRREYIMLKKNEETEVSMMFEPRYKLSYDERRIIVLCLIEMKNKLIRENRYTDAIDDLLVKFMD